MALIHILTVIASFKQDLFCYTGSPKWNCFFEMSIDNNLPKLIISLDWLKIKISSSYGNLEALGSNLYSNPKLWNTFCKVVKLISDFPSISAENNVN